MDDYQAAWWSPLTVSVCGISTHSERTINPWKRSLHWAPEKGIPVMLDAAQAMQHICIRRADLDVEFTHGFPAQIIRDSTGKRYPLW